MLRVMAFIDGENLTARYEDMQKEGATKRTAGQDQTLPWPVTHEPGRFVWSEASVFGFHDDIDLVRAQYYTMFSGGNDEFENFVAQIGSLRVRAFIKTGGQMQMYTQSVQPL